MIDYLYLYILNPIFFYYDLYCEYFENKKIENLQEFYNYYDIENDLIILNYINNQGLEYKLKINRNNENNLKKKIEKLKNLENENDLIVNVSYNNIENLTKRVLSLIGPNGEHNLLYTLRVRDILNLKEINNFCSFELMDMNCDLKMLELDDFIL
jgi:hypothetical protein